MPAESLTKSKPSAPRFPSHAETRASVRPPPSEVTNTGPARLDIFLLSCGVAAPLVYMFTDAILAIRWEGYSYRDQTISQLNAIGAPTPYQAWVGVFAIAVLARAFGCAPAAAAPHPWRDREELS